MILVHLRFLSAQWLIAKRRYMIVFAFVLGALLNASRYPHTIPFSRSFDWAL